MAMEQWINDFPQQFAYKARIENPKSLFRKKRFIVVGMGGSGLAAKLLQAWDASLPLRVHQDYGVPALPAQDFKESLIILSSHSGNTEEVIDALHAARKKKLTIAVVTTGGTLLELAQKYKVPYIQLPHHGIQPRMAMGYSVVALLTFMKHKKGLAEAHTLTTLLSAPAIDPHAKTLAKMLEHKISVIYSSATNAALGNIWKIKLNETAKIPAFWNVLPELNHNEMTGYDAAPTTQLLSRNLHVILLQDPSDHPRIMARMKALTKVLKERSMAVTTLALEGANRFHALFSSILLADFTACVLARTYGVDPENVPMVEEFKRLIVS